MVFPQSTAPAIAQPQMAHCHKHSRMGFLLSMLHATAQPRMVHYHKHLWTALATSWSLMQQAMHHHKEHQHLRYVSVGVGVGVGVGGCAWVGVYVWVYVGGCCYMYIYAYTLVIVKSKWSHPYMYSTIVTLVIVHRNCSYHTPRNPPHMHTTFPLPHPHHPLPIYRCAIPSTTNVASSP